MKASSETHSIHQDPLGLQELPLLEPETDGWPAIQQALQLSHARSRKWRSATGWLAVAASLVLAVVLGTRQTGPVETMPQSVATESPALASTQSTQTVDSLISLSQTLETQLRSLREGTVSMPANSAVYVAELEDMVAQVDSELSYSPDSINLWGQRVNLLLDLAQIYQHQWEIDYGQMASL